MTPLIVPQWQSQLQRYWELLYVLIERNLKIRYRGSFLGVYWSLLNPLLMTGLYTAIFGMAFATYYDNSLINYILAAFTGLTVINFFGASTSQALASIVDSGPLVNKVALPLSLFPISMVGANVFQFLVGMFPLLIVVTLLTSHSLINIIALLCPLFALTLISAGVGLIVSTLYVFFRDFAYFYELVVFISWISSPIFYPVEIVPDAVRPFLLLNPLFPVIESLRQISLSSEWPNLLLIGHSWLNGLIILLIGWRCFRHWQSHFMDLL